MIAFNGAAHSTGAPPAPNTCLVCRKALAAAKRRPLFYIQCEGLTLIAAHLDCVQTLDPQCPKPK